MKINKKSSALQTVFETKKKRGVGFYFYQPTPVGLKLLHKRF